MNFCWKFEIKRVLLFQSVVSIYRFINYEFVFSFGNVPYRCRRFSQMAALSDFHFDEDGWVRSTCLHREGLPVLLWEVLQEFGHTEPPQYYGRVSSEGGHLWLGGPPASSGTPRSLSVRPLGGAH